MTQDHDTTDLRALRHPLFLAALALLLLNDHVLKGADLLPGWATGKLSDFAGLIVAPIALSALLQARTAQRRALAFVLVGGWFAAINLSAAAADATCELLALLGVRSRLWVDPSDLVALSILPLSWHVAAHRPGAAAPRWREKVTLGFAIAACVATSPIDGPMAAAILHNDTGEQVNVTVRWAQVHMSCDRIAEGLPGVLSQEAFGAGTTFTLPPDRVMSLDRRTASTAGGLDTFFFGGPEEPFHQGDCEAALLQIDGLPDMVAFWEGQQIVGYPSTVENDDDRHSASRGLVIARDEDDEDVLRLRPALGYRVAELTDRYLGGAYCEEHGEPQRFDWAGVPLWAGETSRITAIEPTEEGCIDVALERDLEAHEVTLCIPREGFPFHLNAEVQIWNDGRVLRFRRDLPLDDGSLWTTGELLVARGVEGWVQGPFQIQVARTDERCVGERLGCGGVRVPAAANVADDSGVRFVHPGEVLEATADDGRRAHLVVGRAERMIATRDACADHTELGARLDALVWYSEMPRD